MNSCNFVGRTTRDLEVRVSAGENQMSIGRTSLAISGGYGDKKRTEFVNLVMFGKTADNFAKYVKKGQLVAISSHVQTGSYTNKDGQKVNTTDFIVDNFYFAEKASSSNASSSNATADGSGFVNIPDSIEDELPFN